MHAGTNRYICVQVHPYTHTHTHTRDDTVADRLYRSAVEQEYWGDFDVLLSLACKLQHDNGETISTTTCCTTRLC